MNMSTRRTHYHNICITDLSQTVRDLFMDVLYFIPTDSDGFIEGINCKAIAELTNIVFGTDLQEDDITLELLCEIAESINQTESPKTPKKKHHGIRLQTESPKTPKKKHHGIRLQDLDMNIMKYIIKLADECLLDIDDDEYEGLMNPDLQSIAGATNETFGTDFNDDDIFDLLEGYAPNKYFRDID